MTNLAIRRLRVDETIERETLEELLRSLHYQKREYVTLAGEFSLRGRIFDIYPVTYRLPVRLEFEGDRIASIRDFSPVDGNSLANFDEVFLIPLTKVFEQKIKWAENRFEAYEPLATAKQLIPGDYVVHLKYGIGRFLGLKTITMEGVKKKHLAIEYASKEMLYLDVREPLERYVGSEGRAPKVSKLHSKDWERIKERTRKAIESVAVEMIEIQAKRSLGGGMSHPPDTDWQRDFEAKFPFMEQPRAMDRLLAGDVGYGKTEVAMRAAFKCVMGGRQVAFLVPTTVLAEQHYLVLKRRVKDFPVTVEVLSRFRSKKEQQGIMKAAKEGSVDILIGTHRLLSKDLHFKNLGLVIVDEEQRFGVRHKETLKHFRTLVDVLTLTATPIPRTLYMSLVGVRDMSLIMTPPASRMPVETYVMEYSDEILVQAVQRELERKGQVYFVHNRVQSIDKIYRHLAKEMPEVRFGVAHGQMQPQALEAVMQDFLDHKIDCLISTNIIEAGLDIPNVNTIIVNRADLFGLADLYQLRGRVGRFTSKRQAYAYFMVPKNWVLTQDAEKRLSAIERFTALGSGFKIALEDLQIRGAGNLLGHEQSGFIYAVGFDLYCRMLKQVIEDLKK